MPPRSPLPQLHGLDAAWIRTPGVAADQAPPWATMRDFLHARLPSPDLIDSMLEAGEFVDPEGRSWDADDAYQPHTFVWFHRPLAPETPAPFPLEIVEVNERFVVVDKPHFMATMPRGAHVQETALVKARLALDLPELAPAHRLDRLTAGVLVFSARREHRGAYAGVFQSGNAQKTYEALAAYDPALEFPRRLTGRIEKRRGVLQVELVPGEPNAETYVEVIETRGRHARYRLTPLTGKTHQLRLQMAAMGLPIVGDSLYPTLVEVEPDDFSQPLQLIARRLQFKDPIDGSLRDYSSTRPLMWPAQ